MNQAITQRPEQLTIPNVPLETLRFMEKGLAQYGVTLTFFAPHIGIAKHDSGELHFYWQCEDLIVHVWKESGHFPIKLLIGGIRQFVEEAVEDWRVAQNEKCKYSESCTNLGTVTIVGPIVEPFKVCLDHAKYYDLEFR